MKIVDNVETELADDDLNQANVEALDCKFEIGEVILAIKSLNNGRVVSLFRAALTSAERHSNSLRQSKYLMAN